ncbi:MAG: rRNA maturation RNase YbeY [Bacteroidota bacterium]
MIDFFTEDIDFALENPQQVSRNLVQIAEEYGFTVGQLNYILCSDAFLLEINIEYLDHDTYTDIITFDQSEDEGVLEGDIFISVERVAENATTYGVAFETELYRVVAHGLLHLVGFGDKTEAEQQEMRAAEEKALSRLI